MVKRRFSDILKDVDGIEGDPTLGLDGEASLWDNESNNSDQDEWKL